jgi:hypothetical protein
MWHESRFLVLRLDLGVVELRFVDDVDLFVGDGDSFASGVAG